MQIRILPSLLAADIGHLADEIRRAEEAGADELHLDIMDGVFVPNISFGPNIVALARKHTRLPLSVHLMLSRPDKYVKRFVEAGADTVMIHAEASCVVADVLAEIRALGATPAVVLNPRTKHTALMPYLDLVNECLYMTVYPGYGGQKFMPDVLEHIAALREYTRHIGRTDFSIMVDGGVDRDTIGACFDAGADAFVAGTALFGKKDMKAEIDLFRDILQNRNS